MKTRFTQTGSPQPIFRLPDWYPNEALNLQRYFRFQCLCILEHYGAIEICIIIIIIIKLTKKIKVWSSTNPGGRKTKKNRRAKAPR